MIKKISLFRFSNLCISGILIVNTSFLNSSKTNYEQDNEGGKRRINYYLSRFLKADSGINKDGDNPLALKIAILISLSEIASKGSICLMAFLKISIKI